jgi:RNA polymerase sigma-70 factor (ECF subfamily)
MQMSFLDRLDRARAGDQAALEELLDRWRALLRLQARVALRSDLAAVVDSSDIVQETLTQVFRDLNQFRGQTQAAWVAWLRAIVAGQAAKSVRYHTAEKRNHGREVAMNATLEVSTSETPLKELMDEEQAVRLAAAVESLPQAMRDLVVRRVFDREPFDSIARSLNTSPGAARVTWTRAIRKLREVLDSSSA